MRYIVDDEVTRFLNRVARIVTYKHLNKKGMVDSSFLEKKNIFLTVNIYIQSHKRLWL